MPAPSFSPPPPPSGPVPTPYPNIDKLNQASVETKKVKVAAREVLTNRAQYRLYSGDDAGTLKGINSVHTMGKTRFRMGSSKVKVEGKGIVNHLSISAHNAPSPKTGALPQMAPSATVTITLDEIDRTLAEHKKRVVNPGAQNYDASVREQQAFEQKLDVLVNRLTMAPHATPALQVMVNDLAAAVMAAAKVK